MIVMTNEAPKLGWLDLPLADRIIPCEQSQLHSCGPMSLHIALGVLGIAIPESIIIATMPLPKDGASWQDMQAFCTRMAVPSTLIRNGDYQLLYEIYLQLNTPIIVGWATDQLSRHPEPHYSVVNTIAADELVVADSTDGRYRPIRRYRWRDMWFDDEGKGNFMIVGKHITMKELEKILV